MALAQQLACDFDKTLQSQGLSYYRTGKVWITHGSASKVKATVRGSSQLYTVELSWQDKELFATCTCPHAEFEGPCEHLWAVIVASDQKKLLSSIPSNLRFNSDPFPLPDRDDEPAWEPPQPYSGYPRASGGEWRSAIEEIDRQRNGLPRALRASWPSRRQLLYAVDVNATRTSGALIVGLFTRDRKKNGDGFTKPRELRIGRSGIGEVTEPSDREILSLISGVRQYSPWSYQDSLSSQYQLNHAIATIILPLVCNTGRCVLKFATGLQETSPLRWDEGGPWFLELQLSRPQPKKWIVSGLLKRGEERMDLSAPALLIDGGFVFGHDSVSRLRANTPFEWISRLRAHGPIEVSDKERDLLLAAVLEHPTAPLLAVPEELRYQQQTGTPRPRLRIRALDRYAHTQQQLLKADLSFDYEGRVLNDATSVRGLYDTAQRVLILKNPEAEEAARNKLIELGMKFGSRAMFDSSPAWRIHSKKLPAIVRALAEAGWHVEADGKTFRRPSAQRLDVSSGVDWFELRAEIEYGPKTAKVPELLRALRQGQDMVRLSDGTYGLLPEEWVARFAQIASLGTGTGDHLRFRRNQAGLLDALLAARPETSFDAAFERVREQLRQFESVQMAEQPSGFSGLLRDYQREGLGWMHFLRQFCFGGCLADDMGVGKTAQVLALLETRRSGNGDGPCGPSLVVVPKSLVFNWKQEAGRFTPGLRLLDHTGLARSTKVFTDYDVVLTTYGTMRRDAALLQDIEFDYVVLDEAQAIKNASTESAKAARLLRGRHRLVLSGTPVENHLGELWSLFEFLNPGMLGAATVFAGGPSNAPDVEMRHLLARAVRPFILRRTKQQVARELPPKTEQTIYCELDPPQRKLYDELLAHYRNTLLKRVDDQGLQKSKIHVLEALLRLRQAACHPGLLDAARAAEPSAKIDVLMARLAEVFEEGHKALVFSQFTSLLRIVRARLDELGMRYEYLDGATRDRQAHVERFQNDADCRLFLISLKAGGLGLNLTAAEYVFLLDPWWNPATEAQAVDRAHRIGQERSVFAYRLIARGTVEEKVLELQNSKRDLAAAIITEANSVMRDLRREDLELLLS